LKHNKNKEEHDFDRNKDECSAKPKINEFTDPVQCVWRYEAKQEVKGTHDFKKRMEQGRKQNTLEKAAKHSRFGLVATNKRGSKVLKRGEHGQMSV